MLNHFYLPFEKDSSFDHSTESIDKLTEYEKYQLSFHPERPKFLDFLSLFEDVNPCLESDAHGSYLIQSFRANLKTQTQTIPVMLLGQQTGPTSNYKEMVELLKNSDEVQRWNHGMPTPKSYERAFQAVKLGNKEDRMILVFVDTPGADPTEESEAGGIAWRIGNTIQALAESTTPTIAVILNRGCSGGAIALTGCDAVLALENSTYLVITPEACSSILFHTRHRANEAAEASQITSKEGLIHGIVDELIPEPKGPAHRFPDDTVQSTYHIISKWVDTLSTFSKNTIFKSRINRWEKIGHWTKATDEEINSVQNKKTHLPRANSEGFIPRHKDCYNSNGMRKYDPVHFASLEKNNYICKTCGYRYARPSLWDYMEMILDEDSFREHEATRCIIDKDILGFPGYKEKLKDTRKKTGLASSMVTGNGTVMNISVVYCGTEFGFLGGSYCMSSGEKIWQAAKISLKEKHPMIIQTCGGGARMHEGCSSMVSIPKAHIALTQVENAGIPVITIITDPTLGGVAIGIGSRGTRIFEANAGNIGFSGRRVIEQYVGHSLPADFQTTSWLRKNGHVEHSVSMIGLREKIREILNRK